MQQGNSKPAPGSLVVVQDFVNTLNSERGIEKLGSAEEARAWLVGYGLLHESATVTAHEFLHLVEFRERLRDVLAAHSAGPGEKNAEATEDLNRLAQSTTLGVAFETDGEARLVPTPVGREDVSHAIGAILVVVLRATFEGTWRRLKACRSESCRWVFYDTSKNRSGTWCVMEVCGSRAKMRSYRRRSATKPA